MTLKFNNVTEAKQYFTDKYGSNGFTVKHQAGTRVTKFEPKDEDAPCAWYNSQNKTTQWTGVPVMPTPPELKLPPKPTNPKPAPTKTKANPIKATEIKTNVTPPPPVPTPVGDFMADTDHETGKRLPTYPPPPPPQPAPAQIELVKEDLTKKNKRYISKTEPGSKYHLRDRSDVEKPVGVTRRLCEANPGLERKAVIAMAIAAGVNKNTAATQYSLWKAAKAKAAAAEPEGDDEGEE